MALPRVRHAGENFELERHILGFESRQPGELTSKLLPPPNEDFAGFLRRQDVTDLQSTGDMLTFSPLPNRPVILRVRKATTRPAHAHRVSASWRSLLDPRD